MPNYDFMSWSSVPANNATADSGINWQEGQSRASLNDSSRAVMAALALFRNLTNGSITTGGAAAAQTFSSGVSYVSVPTNLRVLLKIGFTTVAGLTLNMDAIGAVTVLRQDGTAIAAGDLIAGAYAELIYNGTNWILLGPLPPRNGLVLLNTLSASNSVMLDDTTSITSLYDVYLIEFRNLVPITDNVFLNLLIQTAGSFQTTGYLSESWLFNQSLANTQEASTTAFQLTGQGITAAAMSNTANGGASGTIWIHGPNSSTWKHVTSQTVYVPQGATTSTGQVQGGIYNGGTGVITGVRFIMSSGNISTGSVRIYGIRTF